MISPMHPAIPVNTIAQVIQLALAPVFLLTGIASLLGVLSNRLGRVVDRARKIEAELAGYDPVARAQASLELQVLGRRMAAAHWALGLCTLSALFVCVVVAIMFIADFVEMRLSSAVAPLFVATMALLIAGLLLFLYEVQIATRSVRVRGAVLEDIGDKS
jgi:hypothetical protein